jgi:hypothetical protein
MAKRKQRNANAEGGETVSGYFRKIFADNPKLLEGRNNDVLLQHWLRDNPGEKEVPDRIKKILQNVKSVLRSQGRKGKKATHANEPRHVRWESVKTRAVRNASPVSKLEALEEHIDECLSLAKIIDREKLHDVIQHLRRARNLVVWQTGE